MWKKVFSFLGVIITLIFIVIFPYLFLEKIFRFTYSSSEWLSFYSNYLTGIIGAYGVILTIYYTIKNANKEREESEKQFYKQIRVNRIPYIVAESVSNSFHAPYILRIGESHDEFYKYDVDILLTNIGYGPLTNFTVNWYAVYEENYIKTNKCLSPNIPTEDSVERSYFYQEGNQLFKSVIGEKDKLELTLVIYSSEEINKNSSIDLRFSCSYLDLFGNQYTQSISFKAISKESDKKGKYQLIVDSKSFAQTSPQILYGR